MKHFLLVIFSFCFIISCTKESNVVPATQTTDSDYFISQFSNILSAAVSAEPELRSFLKDEAMKQFDKDYDVFYPFVKQKPVCDSRSFRDILLKYTDSETLAQIENNEPLLNILVPSWGWIGGFDIKDWNPLADSDIMVGYSDSDNNNILCCNGEVLGVVEKGLLPTSATIIVKRCERMKVKMIRTKSGAKPVYDFSDKAFAPVQTKAKPNTTFVDLPFNPGTNWVKTNDFKSRFPEAYTAWREYGRDSYHYQRQYTTYGMLKKDTLGRLDLNNRESIIAIRLNNTNCIDEENDPNVHQVTKYDTDFDPFETVVNSIWTDGNFEFKICAMVYEKEDNGNGKIKDLCGNMIPARGQDLFDLTRIQHDFYHKTMFSQRRFVCIPYLKDLKPKWYYLPSPFTFSLWEPEKTSSIINIHAYEYDPSDTIKISEKVKKQNGIKVEASIKDLFSFTFDCNSSIQETNADYYITRASDDLGKKEFLFSDPIIVREKNDSLMLNYYNTGSFNFIMVPQSDVK